MRRATTWGILTASLSMAAVFVLKTYADTVFLDTFGVSYVPHLYVALSVLLIGGSAGYSWLIVRGRGGQLDLAMIAVVAILAAIAPLLGARGGPGVFLMALLLTSLPTLANIAVWSVITSIVTGRRSRNFLPQAGAAATIGAVAGGFGSSAVIGLLGVDALAPAGCLLAIGTLAARLGFERQRRAAIPTRRPPRHAPAVTADAPRTRTPAGTTTKAQRPVVTLVRLLVLATLADALMSAVLDYGFKRAAADAFDKQHLGLFFALFYGGVNLLVLLLQLVGSSRLLSTRALRRTLCAQPAAIVVTGLLWAVVPSVAVATLGRGVESVLKFGLSRPAQEIALAPLSNRQRQRWKVLLRGTFAQCGAAAAGLLLILAKPALELHPAVVPGVVVAMASLGLIAQRRVAGAYLRSLGTALGLRSLRLDRERGDLTLDSEGLGTVIDLLGNDDPVVARFGHELLSGSDIAPGSIVARIADAPPKVRATLYQLLAEQPATSDASWLPAMRAAIATEQQQAPVPLAAGLAALAAHGDSSCTQLAWNLTGDTDPTTASGPALAGWSYLAEVGALDEIDHQLPLHQVMARLIATDGRRAASAYRAGIERGLFSPGEVDDSISDAISDARAEQDLLAGEQALIAAALIGRFRTLSKLLGALTDGHPGAQEAVAHLDSAALYKLLGVITARESPPAVRARLLQALRGSDLPEVDEVSARFLADPNAEVRAVATRTLLKLLRERDTDIARSVVDAALRLELQRFGLYLRALPGYDASARESYIVLDDRRTAPHEATRETLFVDELTRRCEHSLGRVCEVLALLGSPETIHAAERALRAPDFKQRRQAVDILQEVARGAERELLFQLLETYLLPPTTPPPEARAAACAIDPWLARCERGELDELVEQLAALRATAIFGAIDGADLEQLARTSGRQQCESGEVIVRAGEPGDALFILLSGRLAVEVNQALVGTLRAGDSFGELAVLDGSPRSATVSALEPTQLLVVPRATFAAALAEHPHMGVGLVRGLSRWLRSAVSQPEAMSSTAIPVAPDLPRNL